MKQQMVLYPEYLESFKCIGSECEDTCCAGWNVQIDKNTYKKYRNLKEKGLNSLFKEHIKRTKKSSVDTNYATVKLNSENRCPFLSEDTLCKIHLELGEDYLSHTCKSYPRSYNKVDQLIEKGAYLSCPEIARKALLKEDRIEFTQSVEKLSNIAFNQLVNTQTEKGKETYFNIIRQFSIGLIQNRQYSLDERLIILGIVLTKIQQNINSNSFNKIEENLLFFQKDIENVKATKKDIANLPTKLKNLHIEIFHIIIYLQFKGNEGFRNLRYLECLDEMKIGLQYSEDVEIDQISENYINAKHNFYNPFIRKCEYILENYLVHTMFQTAFPLKYNDIFDDYVMLVIHYVLIKLHLVGMSKAHKGLTVELCVKLIQSFTKTVDHNQSYLNSVYNYLKENNLLTRGYMAVLINS